MFCRSCHDFYKNISVLADFLIILLYLSCCTELLVFVSAGKVKKLRDIDLAMIRREGNSHGQLTTNCWGYFPGT